MRRGLTVLLAAVVLTGATWIFDASPAHACSCEGTSTESIQQASAAVFGSIIEIDDLDDRFPETNDFVATIDVAIDLKGNIGDQVFVDSYDDDGGNCGSSWRVGQELGVQLYAQPGGALNGDSCGEFALDLAEKYQALERAPSNQDFGSGLSPSSVRFNPSSGGDGSVADPAQPADTVDRDGAIGSFTSQPGAGLSAGIVAAIVGGLAVIALIVLAVLRSERDQT